MEVSSDPEARLAALRERLRRGLVERDEALDLALIAVLAGEHLLLVGPPGTAKSEVARRLRHALRDARSFERLLTKFTVPEEIFGPLSLKGLERDVYERLTQGYLPDAHVAFLDEVFNANSAILNSLLGILNEREIDNGGRRERVPLACVIGATNLVSEGDELAALSDRFVLRAEVLPISDEGFGALLDAEEYVAPASEEQLGLEDLELLRKKVARIVVPPWLVDVVAPLRRTLAKKGIYVSDRRWKKSLNVVRASAVLARRTHVTIADLDRLRACLWQRPEQRAIVDEAVVKRLREVFEEEPARYEALVATLEKTLAEEQRKTTQQHEGNVPLFTTPDGSPTTVPRTRRHKKDAWGQLLFRRPHVAITSREAYTLDELRRESPALADLATLRRYASDAKNWVMEEIEHQPLVEQLRWPAEHVAARVAQIERIALHLRSFAEAASEANAGCDARLEKIEARLTALRDAFAALPVHAATIRIAS